MDDAKKAIMDEVLGAEPQPENPPASDATEQSVADTNRKVMGEIPSSIQGVLLADILEERRRVSQARDTMQSILQNSLNAAWQAQNQFIGRIGQEMAEPSAIESAAVTKILSGDMAVDRALGAKIAAGTPPESLASIMNALAAGIAGLNAAAAELKAAAKT